jgi:sugar lactone lactonase YvrE
MKKLLLASVMIFCFASFAMAQWVYDSDFAKGPQPHGVQVDNADKVWIGYFGAADTLDLATGTRMPCSSLRCYNPDGTQAAFSPVVIFTDGADIVDTLNFTKPYSCRGIQVDHNGNVLYVTTGKLYRINSETGAAMNKVFTTVNASLTKPGVDANGYIYQGHVGGGNPCYIFDEDFELYSMVSDAVAGLQRAVDVTPDGKDLYMPKIYSASNGITHFHSDDGPDGAYTLTDTLWWNPDKVFWAQISNWDRNGLLWIGTYYNVGAGNPFTGWYALDPTQGFAVVDSIGNNAIGILGDAPPVPAVVPPGGIYWSPRGIAFSVDMKTAYTADFDGVIVKKWTNANPAKPGDPILINPPTAVREFVNNILPEAFRLAQNYPNPFNPTTMIPFTLDKRGYVELKVYDVLGREVRTMLKDYRNAGNYEISFNGSGLTSGVYFYRLTFDGKLVTKQMMLLK